MEILVLLNGRFWGHTIILIYCSQRCSCHAISAANRSIAGTNIEQCLGYAPRLGHRTINSCGRHPHRPIPGGPVSAPQMRASLHRSLTRQRAHRARQHRRALRIEMGRPHGRPFFWRHGFKCHAPAESIWKDPLVKDAEANGNKYQHNGLRLLTVAS